VHAPPAVRGRFRFDALLPAGIDRFLSLLSASQIPPVLLPFRHAALARLGAARPRASTSGWRRARLAADYAELSRFHGVSLPPVCFVADSCDDAPAVTAALLSFDAAQFVS
jgi:hypothetical protein